jgi:hypothetical protein
LGKGIFTLDEIKYEMDKDSSIQQFLSNSNKKHEDVLEKLFEFGVIGNLSSSGKWLFKYKDHNIPYNPDHKMLVHFGFTRMFRIRAY